MTLVLPYLLVLVVVAAVLFGLASVLFGRGETLPPLPRGTTPTVLPAAGLTGADVTALRFSQTLRGYRAADVDWALERLAAEIDALRGRLAETEIRAAGTRAEPGDGARPGLVTAPPPAPAPAAPTGDAATEAR